MIFVDVQVRMVTGDNAQTARAIALECGILTSDADASEPNLGMDTCIRLVCRFFDFLTLESI